MSSLSTWFNADDDLKKLYKGTSTSTSNKSFSDKIGFHYREPYTYNLPKSLPEVDIKRKRSNIDRFFDVLSIGTYAVLGGLYNLTDGKDDTGALRGVWEGVKAGNPFGEGNEKRREDYL